MKMIGLTGGMGSGKTTVLKCFEKWGATVYIADEKAKILMQSDAELMKKIKNVLGEKSYEKNTLNKKYIANKIFGNKNLLKQINLIVHRAVRLDFEKFKNNVKTKCVFYETALLFENESADFCDKIILVIAPKNLLVRRIMLRDDLKKEAILKRMQHQIPDEYKISKADYLIKNNSDLKKLEREAKKIYQKILASYF